MKGFHGSPAIAAQQHHSQQHSLEVMKVDMKAWNSMAILPKPVKEVPLPRMLMPGWGIFDMPTFGAYPGLPAQSEADDDDATSSYNATEVLGSRAAEISRLGAQIKLSFHKEVRGMRLEPTPQRQVGRRASR